MAGIVVSAFNAEMSRLGLGRALCAITLPDGRLSLLGANSTEPPAAAPDPYRQEDREEVAELVEALARRAQASANATLTEALRALRVADQYCDRALAVAEKSGAAFAAQTSKLGTTERSLQAALQEVARLKVRLEEAQTIVVNVPERQVVLTVDATTKVEPGAVRVEAGAVQSAVTVPVDVEVRGGAKAVTFHHSPDGRVTSAEVKPKGDE